AIAFSTNQQPAQTFDTGTINQFFLAAVEAVEESIYDALFTAETVVGERLTLPALPAKKVIKLIKERRPNV
ncbi:MAG TPA: P1 family peptidase, partial [Candidatus Acidoferrum sp.]|nr:P1 family peptidase [Candidatus Acidoferrum sp.]